MCLIINGGGAFLARVSQLENQLEPGRARRRTDRSLIPDGLMVMSDCDQAKQESESERVAPEAERKAKKATARLHWHLQFVCAVAS